MALKERLTANIDYVWLNHDKFQESYALIIMSYLGTELTNSIKKNNKLPSEGSLIYGENHVFKITEIKKEKGSFFNAGKSTVFLSFVAEDKEKMEKRNLYEPLGKIVGERYEGYYEIGGRKVKIMFPLSSVPNNESNEQSVLDMSLGAASAIIGYYYKSLGVYPNVGEIISSGGDLVIQIKNKYFIAVYENGDRNNLSNRLGFVVEFNYDTKDLGDF